MHLLDLPDEILKEILSYNTFPFCISVCVELHDIEKYLMNTRISESQKYLCLEDTLYHRDIEMYYFLVHYTEIGIADIDMLLLMMVDLKMDLPSQMKHIAERHDRHDVVTRCLYNKQLSHLIEDLMIYSYKLDEISSIAVHHGDLRIVEMLLSMGASPYIVMDDAVMANNDKLISILVSRYDMEYPDYRNDIS